MSLEDSTIEEPTMIGDTPEDRARARQRRKRIRMAAAIVAVILAVGVIIAFLPTTPSQDFTVDRVNSRCAAGGSLSCTVVLNPRAGYTATVSMVKSVQINGTVAKLTNLKMLGKEISLGASVPLVATSNCLPDIGCSVAPPTAAAVAVLLTDGTTVSAVIGATNGE